MLLSPTVRWYRRKCSDSEEHCTNFCSSGYRKGMLADLKELKDAMMELCREEGMQMYKVMSTCELLGLRAAMEEDEVERILGSDPVHMTEDGFVTLAENMVRTLDNPATLFVGEQGRVGGGGGCGWLEEEDTRVVVQYGVRDGGQEGQQGVADEGDGAGQPAQPSQPGTWEQWR